MRKRIRVLGTRGIPAKHGGFETFAENLALHLIRKGWEVTVYCQVEGDEDLFETQFDGIRLIHICVPVEGAMGTIIFDWKATLHAARERGLILTLGYNTAILGILYRVKGLINVINMDGIEWKREKWSFPERAWLYLNERIACWLGQHLIADHPEIKKHLTTCIPADKITMIPYGANAVEQADSALIETLGLKPGQYALIIARPEPENSILELVKAFSAKSRGMPLVMLGNYDRKKNSYHSTVISAASNEVLFPGAIYDKPLVEALRFHTSLYIHGHTVGGTNPSLVEALGAGSPVLAHDNKFNRWVAGLGAHYFQGELECASRLDVLLGNEVELAHMRHMSRARFREAFTWDQVLESYEELLESWCA